MAIGLIFEPLNLTVFNHQVMPVVINCKGLLCLIVLIVSGVDVVTVVGLRMEV